MKKINPPEAKGKKGDLVRVNDDIAADAIANALRKAPNGEGMIPCLARDMVRELKKMGYVMAKSPTPKPSRRAQP